MKQSAKPFLGLLALFAVALPNADLFAEPGDPVLTFGGDGRVTTPIDSYSNCIYDFVAPTPDSKIMAAGFCLRRDSTQSLGALLVARYNVDGTPDRTFNGTGYLLKDMYSPGSENPDFGMGRSAAQFALQSDGKWLVVGTALRDESADPTGIIRWGQNDIALFRFKADGWPDPDFGTEGEVITELPDGLRSYATAVQVDTAGKILVGGILYDTRMGQGQLFVTRYLSSGLPDTSFGSAGLVRVAPAEAAGISGIIDLAITTRGKILFSGCYNESQCLVGRLDSSGVLDSTFEFNLTQRSRANPSLLLVRSPDGTAEDNVVLYTDTGIMRLKDNGSLDYSWSFFPFGAMSRGQFAVQHDGKIIASFLTYDSSVPVSSKLLRLLPSGDLDTRFAQDGYVPISRLGERGLEIHTVAVLPDQQIVAAGSEWGTATVALFEGDTRPVPALQLPYSQRKLLTPTRRLPSKFTPLFLLPRR